MAEPSQYPIFLDLSQCPVLIVGGGAVALRKAHGLVQAKAHVTVVSPEFAEGFNELKAVDRITAPYAATHMSKKAWRLVFIATNDPQVNETVQKHAAAHGVLCCRSDEPELGDFTNGATWVSEGGQVALAIASGGASPVLATRLRETAVAAIDPMLITWAELMSAWRKRAKRELSDAALRRELLTRMAGPEMEECLRARGAAAAGELFTEWLLAVRTVPSGKDTAGRVLEHGK